MLNTYKLTRYTIEKSRKFPIRRCILSISEEHFRVRLIWARILQYYRAYVPKRSYPSRRGPNVWLGELARSASSPSQTLKGRVGLLEQGKSPGVCKSPGVGKSREPGSAGYAAKAGHIVHIAVAYMYSFEFQLWYWKINCFHYNSFIPLLVNSQLYIYNHPPYQNGSFRSLVNHKNILFQWKSIDIPNQKAKGLPTSATLLEKAPKAKKSLNKCRPSFKYWIKCTQSVRYQTINVDPPSNIE